MQQNVFRRKVAPGAGGNRVSQLACGVALSLVLIFVFFYVATTLSATSALDDSLRLSEPASERGDASSSRRPMPRVAISALLTANSKRGESLERAIDGLAVLRRSIKDVSAKSTFKQLSFVPILAPSVDPKWEPVLKQLGWTKIKRYDSAPIEASKIRNPQIAKEIVTDGAIGIDELLKLNVFEWGDEFDVVLLLDCDILFHRPFTELFFKPSGKSLRWTRGGWAAERINGGFLVIEPKGEVGKKHRQAMLDIVLEGDFRPGTGWRGSGIGWTYGGRTVQGVLPYYFLHVLNRTAASSVATEQQQLQDTTADHQHSGDSSNNNNNKAGHGSNTQDDDDDAENDRVLSFSHRAELQAKHRAARRLQELRDDEEIDRCRYNNMDQLPECKKRPMPLITSNHFTGDCVKPFWCGVKRSSRCEWWARRWRMLLAQELIVQGLPPKTSSTALLRMSSDCSAIKSVAGEILRNLTKSR